jgi:hypothetical protein
MSVRELLQILRNLPHILRNLPKLTRSAGNQRWGSHSLLILAPIRAGERAALARRLKALEPERPLAELDEVHFARWVVLDQLKTGFPGAPKRPARLDRPYLLFTAEFTPLDDTYAAPKQLLERLASVGEAVWQHCDGFPEDQRGRVDFLARYRCDTTLYYAGYPAVTPADVKTAVERRDGLAQFVLEHRDERDAAKLQRLYLQEAASWF